MGDQFQSQANNGSKYRRRNFLKSVGTAGVAGVALFGSTVSAEEQYSFIYDAAMPMVIEDGQGIWVPNDDDISHFNSDTPQLHGTWLPNDYYQGGGGDEDDYKFSLDMEMQYYWHSNAPPEDFGTVSLRRTVRMFDEQGRVVNSEGGDYWKDLTSPDAPDGESYYRSISGYEESALLRKFQYTEVKFDFDFSSSNIDPGTGSDIVSSSYFFATPDHSYSAISDMIDLVGDLWDATVSLSNRFSTVDLTAIQRAARLYMAMQIGAIGGKTVFEDEGDLITDAAIDGISAFGDAVEDAIEFDIEGYSDLRIQMAGPTMVINPESDSDDGGDGGDGGDDGGGGGGGGGDDGDDGSGGGGDEDPPDDGDDDPPTCSPSACLEPYAEDE